MKSITTILLLCLCTVLGVQAQEIRQHDKFWDGVTLWEVNAIYGGKTVFMVGTGEIYLSLEKVAGKPFGAKNHRGAKKRFGGRNSLRRGLQPRHKGIFNRGAWPGGA